MLHLKVISPEGILVDRTDIESVYVPSQEGMMEVLPGHASIMAALETGTLLFSYQKQAGFLKISGGILSLSEDVLNVMIDVGEEASLIDVERAKRALSRAEARLAANLSQIDVKRAQEAKKRALARIETSRLAQLSYTETQNKKENTK